VLRSIPTLRLMAGLGGLTLLATLAIVFSRSLRESVRSVPLRLLVGYHAIRIVAGIVFIFEVRAGRLPEQFVQIAAFGDIAVGVAALLLLPFVSDRPGWRRAATFGWNVAGLADILIVLATGRRLATTVEGSMARMGEFPLSLLPTFIVPLVLVTHGVIFWRLFTARPVEDEPEA
jgi:hypothetical protein